MLKDIEKNLIKALAKDYDKLMNREDKRKIQSFLVDRIYQPSPSAVTFMENICRIIHCTTVEADGENAVLHAQKTRSLLVALTQEYPGVRQNLDSIIAKEKKTSNFTVRPDSSMNSFICAAVANSILVDAPLIFDKIYPLTDDANKFLLKQENIYVAI